MSSCIASQTTWHCSVHKTLRLSASEWLVSLLQLYFLTNIHSSCIGDASTLHKCPSACRRPIRRLWRQPLLRMRNERWVQSGGKRTTIMSIIKLRASPSAYHHHNHHITITIITITSGHTRLPEWCIIALLMSPNKVSSQPPVLRRIPRKHRVDRNPVASQVNIVSIHRLIYLSSHLCHHHHSQHHYYSFTHSLETQNLLFQQILPTLSGF